MTSSSPGLSRLMYQAQYAGTSGRSARYAARFYRPIIFCATLAIVLITLWQYRDAPRLVWLATSGGLLVYAIFFAFRLRMHGATESRFYQPHIQFLRGQSGILGVSLLIGLLAAYGFTNHELWLLYVLSTLIISEHNSTKAVLCTLAEVAILLVSASYIGWGVESNQWNNWAAFLVTEPHLTVRILWIWLITFVFHYLVRNIHGRDMAYEQHQKWLDLVMQQTIASEQPIEQRRALLACAQQLAGATAELWIPRLGDGRLVDTHGRVADAWITARAAEGRPCVALSKSQGYTTIGMLAVCQEPPADPAVSAQLIVPIRRVDGEQEIIAILDLSYTDRQPDPFQLAVVGARVLDLANHARLMLIMSAQEERQQLVEHLAATLYQLLDARAVAKQVVDDVVDQFGFDFATVSVVDTSQSLIRCIEGKNASWVKASVHPLTRNDVQSRTVCEGRVFQNEGQWEPHLDKGIWKKYRHAELSRVWVPIPRPSTFAGLQPAVGTIEAGFRHARRRTIPPELIIWLQQYAAHVGRALANAWRHERQRELADALAELHTSSRMIQGHTALYDPDQMAQLVGRSAEKLLNAPIVMLYTWDEDTKDLRLPYISPHAIRGKSELTLRMGENDVLSKLYRERKSYFSPDAHIDPHLVKLNADGRPERWPRTFTQRQNIKSFVGVPLIGNAGHVLGFLCVNYRNRHEFYPEECKIIELFALQAAVALEETYKHRLAQQIAISQERANLAAELHHNLSQSLFALNQNACAAYSHAKRGDFTLVLNDLEKISSIAATNLDELGYLLTELRQGSRPQADFVAELTEHIKRLRLLYRSNIYFEPGFEPGPVTNLVPAQVQFYLLRIGREALNNALRHARDADIHITYRVGQAGDVSLMVQDTGPGFDVGKAQHSGHYGIAAMEYYARKINSQLTIKSHPGQGTLISVSFIPPPVENNYVYQSQVDG